MCFRHYSGNWRRDDAYQPFKHIYIYKVSNSCNIRRGFNVVAKKNNINV